MNKRAFPKNLKFGTYLPTNSMMGLIKIDVVTKAFERFLSEYFDGIANVKINVNAATTDSIYIAGEHTAYLFRCVMDVIYDGSMMDITVMNNDREYSVCFATKKKCNTSDLEKYDRLTEVATLSGFAYTVVGNMIILRAPLLHGRLVISAVTYESFYEQLRRVFFAPHWSEYYGEVIERVYGGDGADRDDKKPE